MNTPLPKHIEKIIYIFSWSGFFVVLLGLFDLLLRKSGLAVEYSALLSLILCVTLYQLIVKNNDPPETDNFYTRKELAFSFLILAIGLIVLFYPVLIASFLMGSGNYPRVFFNVDSPYHLSQVRALISSEAYPPESLNNAGIKFLYHYGTQLSAASISRIGGITAHAAYFIYVPLLLLAGIFFSLLKISLVRNRVYLLSALIFLGLFFNTEWLFWADIKSVDVFNVEAFLGGYPHISILAAIYLFLFAIMHNEKFGLSASSGVVVVLALSLITLVKSPFIFASAGFFLGFVISKVLLDKSVRNAITLSLLYTLIVLALISVVSGNISELVYTGLFSQAKSRNLALSPYLFLMLVVLTYSFIYINRQLHREYFPYILAIILPGFIYLSFDLQIGGKSDANIRQAVSLGYIFMAAIFIKMILMHDKNIWIKRSVLLAFVLITTPVIVNRINSALLFTESKSGWHEHVNNEKLAECLIHIPVNGSMLVTNDLRYPANNFARDMMQLQIPTLFGHAMYAGNARYESNYVDMSKFNEQRLLIDGSLGEIDRYASLRGWSHGVIFKRKPFSRGDWKVICENEEVLIYSYK